MKLKICILVFWTITLVVGIGAAEQNGLELVASCIRDQDGRTHDEAAQGDGVYRYSFTVILTNVSSDTIAIPKDKSGIGYGEFGLQFELAILYGLGRTALGSVDIPAESELALVKLRPGEAIEFQPAVRTDKPVEETAWSVVYKVEPDLSKRFGTWAGRIETKTIDHFQLDRMRSERLKAKGLKP
jgi:hypothetical protein